MSRGDVKKGREAKKPKQDGAKKSTASAYSQRQAEAGTTSLKIRNK